MDSSTDAAELIFKAEVRGRIFGVIVARSGRATALTSKTAIKDVLTIQAMTWLIDQNPWPTDEVRFTLVNRVELAGLHAEKLPS